MESNLATQYQDPTPERVITKRELHRMVWRSLFLQASFNYERMQACGWLYSMIPALEKIHTNKKDLASSMKLHMEFFNTHPFLVTFIMGIVTAMEENKEDQETIRGIKVATMGPLGGIGDAMFWLTALPITAGIGASLAIEGNIIGPILFLVLFNVLHFGLRFGLMSYGYNTGVRAMQSLKENTKHVSRAATIVGLTVIGALIASYISLKIPVVVTAGQAKVALQADVLDKIIPNLLPFAYTVFMYYLLKKNFSPVKLIGLTVVIGVVGKVAGVL